jgi:hypothetical protein
MFEALECQVRSERRKGPKDRRFATAERDTLLMASTAHAAGALPKNDSVFGGIVRRRLETAGP